MEENDQAALAKEEKTAGSDAPEHLTDDFSVSPSTLFKLDIRLMPVLTMVFLLAYLDRTNIGNARIAGLQKDLKLSNVQHGVDCHTGVIPTSPPSFLSISFSEYGDVIDIGPKNIESLYQAAGADRVLPTMLTLWGVASTLQATLFSAATLSGAFGGLLAFAIVKMDGIGGKPGWAWLFFLEGIFSTLFGLVSFFLLPRSIETASFLSPSEKERLLARMRHEGALNDEADDFSWKEIGRALARPQVLLITALAFFVGVILASLFYFTPSILVALGYTAAKAQLMSVPPFAVGFVVTIASTILLDKRGFRGVSIIVASLFCAIGFILYLRSTNPHVQYGSLFFSISGISFLGPSTGAWISNNVAPQTRRATAIASGFIATNIGGMIALWLFSAWSEPPRYTSGTIVLLVFSFMMVVTAFFNILYLQDQNRKKGLVRGKGVREEEEPGLGDRSAWFIYIL
ncbi:hypothetical protein DXG01_007737 [Tephrocybe rancida]|nr:hypothetical protein DXG01_007737 [Tephrocybe rancida]